MTFRSPLLIAIQVLTVLGPGAMLLCMILNGEPLRPGWWLLALPFLGLATLPYLLVLRAAKRLGTPKITWLYFGITVFITLGGLLILWEAFWLRPDPQAGLVFLFVPLYQIAIVLVARGVAQLIIRRG